MKKEYDFKNIKWKRNPYARKLKKQITIRLDQNVVVYFQEIAKEIEIPYQTLINLYLKDCVLSKRRLVTSWKKSLKAT